MEPEYWEPYDNYLCESGVTVAEFETEEDCDFAVYLLRERGINSGVLRPGKRLDLRWLQLRVSPDDEEGARRILARPVASAERTAYPAEPETAPFAVPRCPKCESQETVLEAVEKENVWRCSQCEETWTETVDVPEAS